MGEYSSDKNSIEFCDIYLSKDMIAELYKKYDAYVKRINDYHILIEIMDDKKLTKNEIIKKYFFDKIEKFNVLNIEMRSEYSCWDLKTYYII